MKKFLLLVLMVWTALSYSQELDYYKVAADKFMTLYNNENIDGIFELFDENMKAALPIDNATAFFSDLRGKNGSIRSMEFISTRQSAHVYKTTFKNGIKDIIIYLSDTELIGGLFVTPHRPEGLKKIERNKTQIGLPFNEEWHVFWGGKNQSDNYHVVYENQMGAYDLVIFKDGKSYQDNGYKNEDYYAFGKEILAPCHAKVVKVIAGVQDNVPGQMNRKDITGNTIILETQNKEYLLLAHLKAGSIVVKEGQNVERGDLLGLCGNSGNSSEPHLHLSLQNTVDMEIATGAWLYFDKIMVNGEIKEDYLPVKNEKIQNVKL